MKGMLLLAAIGLTVTGAGACEYQRSAKAKADPTIVASAATASQPSMSTAEDARPSSEEVIVEEKAE